MPVKTEPYDVGDDVVLQATFTDASDLRNNPATVTCEVISPAGATTFYTSASITNPTTGLFQAIYPVAGGYGNYHVTWRGAGAFAIVKQSVFHVQRPAPGTP